MLLNAKSFWKLTHRLYFRRSFLKTGFFGCTFLHFFALFELHFPCCPVALFALPWQKEITICTLVPFSLQMLPGGSSKGVLLPLYLRGALRLYAHQYIYTPRVHCVANLHAMPSGTLQIQCRLEFNFCNKNVALGTSIHITAPQNLMSPRT